MQTRLASIVRIFATAALTFAGSMTSCQEPAAAAGSLPDRLKPMQVRIVREATPGCAPDCLEWIAAEGRISGETRIAFERVFRSLGTRRLPIFIDSGGGSVTDAIAIGRMVRARGLDVIVTRTLPDRCEGALCPVRPALELARPQVTGSVCASACPLILAGGKKRIALLGTYVGVHRMITNGVRLWKQKTFRVVTRTVDGVRMVDRSLIDERVVRTEHYTTGAPESVYDHVERYLDEMGVKPPIMPLMLSAAPSSMHWMSRDELQTTALLTENGGGDYLATALRKGTPTLGPSIAEHPSTGPDAALLVDAARDEARRKITPGSVAWALERSSGTAGLVLFARVDVPQTHLGLDLRIAPEKDADLTGPLRVDLTFRTLDGSLKRIKNVSSLQARSEAPLQTSYLPGMVTSSAPGRFEILLERQTNGIPTTSLLSTRRWIVLPILTDTKQIVELRLEHGAGATQLMTRAFAAWNATVVTLPDRPVSPSDTLSSLSTAH